MTPFANRLASARTVYVPDQRGHGETDHARDYSWRLWIDDVVSFADSVGLDRFDLVGHSMGATHAVRLAGLHPQRVQRLVLLEGGFGPFTSPQQDEFWTTAFRLNPDDGFESIDAYVDLVCQLFPRSGVNDVRAGALHFTQRSDGRWSWPYPADINHFNGPEPTTAEEDQLYGEVTSPALVVRAALSELFVGDAYRELADRLGAGTAALLPDAGHNIQWENVNGSASMIRDFLES
jgi:N-formylmaleamate deformylase